MENLPAYATILFLLTAIAALWLLYKASGNSKKLLFIALGWLIIQGLAGYAGFYQQTQSITPRFMLLVLPPVIAIASLFIIPAGQKMLNAVDIKWATWLHIVRIPVEVVILLFFIHGYAPRLMTFEGRNFDILSGISAPIIALFVNRQTKTGRAILLVWNFICLGLLINIVSSAVLSAPFGFQQMGFEQPNVALLYFPFVWLPGFIVPAVLLCHVAVIRKLILNKP